MIVGHNPGMEELLCYLVSEDQIDDYNPMPTAAFAQIEVPDRAPYPEGCGNLLRHVRPRDIENNTD
jgi:phosphohistidine phosphatase SixA